MIRRAKPPGRATRAWRMLMHPPHLPECRRSNKSAKTVFLPYRPGLDYPPRPQGHALARRQGSAGAARVAAHRPSGTMSSSSHKGNKQSLPSKPCVACGRAMSWRKKWEKNWEQVKYCSEACRRAGASR
jgi:hypothetical protein